MTFCCIKPGATEKFADHNLLRHSVQSTEWLGTIFVLSGVVDVASQDCAFSSPLRSELANISASDKTCHKFTSYSQHEDNDNTENFSASWSYFTLGGLAFVGLPRDELVL